MKLRDKRTGIVFEPASDFVYGQMLGSGNFEPMREETKKETAKRSTRKSEPKEK